MNKLIALSTLLASLSLCVPVLAWNRAGHMVSGAIAYAELKKIAPQSVPRVINLLKKHPYYQTKWQAEIAEKSPSDPDLYLFMSAARWADDARKDPTDHRRTWHYINFPFQLGSTPTTAPSVPTGAENILTAFDRNRTLLETPGTTANKAIALCWVFHSIGDVHQPLHTTKAISAAFPTGDLGGNLFYIRAKADRSTISLHTYWDDLILGSVRGASPLGNRYQSVQNRALA